MSRRSVTLVLSFTVLAAHAQQGIEGRLLDAGNRAPLPYASIVVKGAPAGTVTNAEGRFRIVAQEHDTLLFSYLGFRPKALTGADVLHGPDILLEPATTQLAELDVVGRSTAEHRLLIRAAKILERTRPYTSKVYYELGTHAKEYPVEAIECFYNATIHGADIEALDLKNGRIAVAPEEGRYVMNLNTSKGFMLLHPTDRSSAFPGTPLQYRSVKALREHYDITLVSIVGSDPPLHRIRFEPRIADGSHFSGTAWVEPKEAIIHRLELRCDTCNRHPFLPYDPQGTLSDVAIRYALEWSGDAGSWSMDRIELDYALTFRDRPDDPRMALRSGLGDRRMRTRGVMHFFDHDRPFILPVFHYDTEQMDYRKILALPFDSVFWREAPLLLPTEQQQRDLDLFARHGMLTGRKALDPNSRTGFFESNMACWSADRRITLKNTRQTPYTAPMRSAVADIERVHLVAQLFLNIDETPEGHRTFTSTVFDGFRSYHDLPEQPFTPVLLNLFFDLCEGERRKLQIALEEPGLSLPRIRALHAAAVRNMERTTDLFLRETHLGTDERALQRWNDRVQREVGIDNLRMFGLKVE
ncbi:MAG TPA: carboxypeptidase-like regulatory domain-containing protein [Flavobacteriales bacterium]